MDGHFVPNLTIGPDVVAAVRRETELPLHVHLMIEHPERYIERFAEAGASTILVHPEAPGDIPGAVEKIRAKGCAVGIVLNPETPVARAAEFLPEADDLLVMSVHPGFGGQSFMPEVLGKFAEAAKLLRPGAVRSIDGGIDVGTAPAAVSAGADTLIRKVSAAAKWDSASP